MSSRKTMRLALDIALTIMIVLEMFIQFTGEFLHEIIGFAFFASIVAHIALSGSWIKKTAQNAKSGRLGARRAALAAVGCLLAITTIVLGVSSIAISGILASAGFTWPFGTYALWVTIHTVSAYALCALTVVHLAMHWAFLASVFRVPYDPMRRRAIGAGVNAIAGLGVIALGAAATKETFLQVTEAAERSKTPAESEKQPFPQDVMDAPAEESASAASGASNNSSNSSASKGKKGKRHSGNGNASSRVKSKQYQSASSNAEHTQEGLSSTADNNTNDLGNNDSGDSEIALEQDSNTSTEDNSSEYYEWSSENESESYYAEESNSIASGICTLCRKQCPLSAPRCDKPYQAGLI